MLVAAAAAVCGARAALSTSCALTQTPDKIEINPTYLEHLRSLPPIPRKIHMIWPDRRVVNDPHPMVKHGLRALIDLNPDWNTTVYEYDDIDRYIQASPLLSVADKAMLTNSHIIERTDAFRLLIMYQEGGFYMDMDKVYNKPLTPLIGTETRMLLTTAYDANFVRHAPPARARAQRHLRRSAQMQALMCTPPGNLVFKRAVEAQWAIRRRAPLPPFSSGPAAALLARCPVATHTAPRLPTGRGPTGQGLPRAGGWLRKPDVMKMGPDIYMKTIMDVVVRGTLRAPPALARAANTARRRRTVRHVLAAAAGQGGAECDHGARPRGDPPRQPHDTHVPRRLVRRDARHALP